MLAAGRSERFGSHKLWEELGGKPLWLWSYESLIACPKIEAVGIVCQAEEVERFKLQATAASFVCPGGATRSQSVRAGIKQLSDWNEGVLVHDAARPFVSRRLIEDVCHGVERRGAACPFTPVTDTIKVRTETGMSTLDRDQLLSVQTPQGASMNLYMRALETDLDTTDDMAMMEAAGVVPELVKGDPNNFKITFEQDLQRARSLVSVAETRTGFGYDVHSRSDDPSRQLWIGGVLFEGEQGLAGHSDADVLIHAIVDALLGACSLGDIGQLFPNTAPQWKDYPSIGFLETAANQLAAADWQVVSIDSTVVAEEPKIMPRSNEICRKLAGALRIDPTRLSVKATTQEGLGSIGRGEGICAFAVATVRRIT